MLLLLRCIWSMNLCRAICHVATLGANVKGRYSCAMIAHFTSPPLLDDFEYMAREAYRALPRELSQYCDGVVVRVENFPDAEIERGMGLESPFDLLGLYQGVALGDKSLADTPLGVDMIFLYRRPILDYWCESGEDLQHLIRHVLIHEIGHHFGLSDADMERIEATVGDVCAY